MNDHPALEAWRKLHPDTTEPRRIEVLKQNTELPGKTAVFWLEGVGPGGVSVVAKRSRSSKARVERAVYETVLPRLQLPTLSYYGYLEEDETPFSWLFLEDVRGEHYSRKRADHRVVAALWLGVLHTSAEPFAADAGLPRKGPVHYLDLLHTAHATISASLGSGALGSADTRVLETVLAQCERLALRWGDVSQLCSGVLDTVAHGDLVGKNLMIRTDGGGPALFPLDWESSGFGVPAVDIAFIDATAYRSAIEGSWPEVDSETLARVATVGRIFWHVSAIRWGARDLLTRTEASMQKIERHHEKLAPLLVGLKG